MNTAIVKINSHDPRGHQEFLQLSAEMQYWQSHINDHAWWQEREQQCNELIKKYGYDLQIGVQHCLIACKTNGWKGIANASSLLANGFTKQHPQCWPPHVAKELRNHILDRYCQQVLPCIYTLPTDAISTDTLKKLSTATMSMQRHASDLQSAHQSVFQQLVSWLESRIKMQEQNVSAAAFSTKLLPPLPSLIEKKLRHRWQGNFLFIVIGSILSLSTSFIVKNLENPHVISASQQFWPNNPLVTSWKQRMSVTSTDYTLNYSTEQFNQQLDALEQRLLDAENKKRSYLTISELKTIVYQLRETVQQQSSTIDNQLIRLLQLQDSNQPISSSGLNMLTSHLESFKNRVLLLEYSSLVNEKYHATHQ